MMTLALMFLLSVAPGSRDLDKPIPAYTEAGTTTQTNTQTAIATSGNNHTQEVRDEARKTRYVIWKLKTELAESQARLETLRGAYDDQHTAGTSLEAQIKAQSDKIHVLTAQISALTNHNTVLAGTVEREGQTNRDFLRANSRIALGVVVASMLLIAIFVCLLVGLPLAHSVRDGFEEIHSRLPSHQTTEGGEGDIEQLRLDLGVARARVEELARGTDVLFAKNADLERNLLVLGNDLKQAHKTIKGSVIGGDGVQLEDPQNFAHAAVEIDLSETPTPVLARSVEDAPVADSDAQGADHA